MFEDGKFRVFFKEFLLNVTVFGLLGGQMIHKVDYYEFVSFETGQFAQISLKLFYLVFIFGVYGKISSNQESLCFGVTIDDTQS